jgi:hypothetical protein
MKINSLTLLLFLLLLGSCTVTKRYHQSGFNIQLSNRTTKISRVGNLQFNKRHVSQFAEVKPNHNFLRTCDSVKISISEFSKSESLEGSNKFDGEISGLLKSQPIEPSDTSNNAVYRKKLRRNHKVVKTTSVASAVDAVTAAILLATSGQDKFLTVNQFIAVILFLVLIPILIVLLIASGRSQKYRDKLKASK